MKFPIILKVSISIFAFTLMSACAHNSGITNLSSAELYSEPTVSTYKDPEANFGQYQTFSVFPQSMILEKTGMNEILEKQMLFFLRNQIEARGYRFVELNQGPDFLATIDVFSKYESSYEPPKTVTVPQFVPGRTVTSYGSSSGRFNFNSYGSYSSYGWGNYSGTSTSKTYVPGYTTTQTYTRSGYTVGHYFPAAGVSIFDGRTFERVWLGTGAGTSDNADVRISSQLVINHIFAAFPQASSFYGYQPIGGAIGIGVGILTNDGNNYLPTITKVAKHSPAESEGLRKFDMISAVDNISVVNKSYCEVFKLIDGKPGTSSRLDVLRTGEKLTIEVIRVPRESIRW